MLTSANNPSNQYLRPDYLAPIPPVSKMRIQLFLLSTRDSFHWIVCWFNAICLVVWMVLLIDVKYLAWRVQCTRQPFIRALSFGHLISAVWWEIVWNVSMKFPRNDNWPVCLKSQRGYRISAKMHNRWNDSTQLNSNIAHALRSRSIEAIVWIQQTHRLEEWWFLQRRLLRDCLTTA